MVKYYGRARQRTGSVNTNQTGLKMSGCPSRVGRNPVNVRHISQRVNCMNGLCAPVLYHGVPWRTTYRNFAPYCVLPSNKCLAMAGGIHNIYIPSYRTPAPGERGCCPPRPHTSGTPPFSPFCLQTALPANPQIPSV